MAKNQIRHLLITGLRTLTIIILAALCFLRKEAHFNSLAQSPEIGFGTAQDASFLGMRLLRDYPDFLDKTSQAEISAALRKFAEAGSTVWLMGSTHTALTAQQLEEGFAKTRELYRSAVQQVSAGLEHIPGLITLSATTPISITRIVSTPFQSAILVVHRRQGNDQPSSFVWKKVELSAEKRLSLDFGGASDFFGVVELQNPLHLSDQFQLLLAAGSQSLAEVVLSTTVPPLFPLQVDIRDSAGTPTEAAIGFYSEGKRLLVPGTALDFSSGGYNYEPTNFRDHGYSNYWPGSENLKRCFFVRGQFNLNLPAGSYRLIATKGPEYLPVDRTISILPNKKNFERIELRRWINMSEEGWHSGDCHVHYARPDREADQRLLIWTQAEDLQMGNILRMGDAAETYFEQYAFGRSGRFLFARGAFVPGQEDPRTGVLGHTMSLNIQAPIRDPLHYYLYGKTFDVAHRQGGLSGYAHVNNDSFLVHRDMTINIPLQKVDFVEICESNFDLTTDLYYKFLNLGFRLTAVAGSDAPWGGTVGDARVYAYTGKKFDADEWFEALKEGHTFVTSGPMLEFTVGGHLPGEAFGPEKGTRLRIHARATVGEAKVRLGRLEIIANGEIICFANPLGSSAALDFDLAAEKSMWIAARVADAHTTPVYLTVQGKRHWKISEVPSLLEERLQQLDETERLINENGTRIVANGRPEWENAEAFRKGSAELRQAVQEARGIYLRLRQDASRER